MTTSTRLHQNNKTIAQVNRNDQMTFFANCELDLHADTSVAGANFRILEYTNPTCSITPFANSYKKKENVPIVKAATAYDDENTGTTYILILGKALYFGANVDASLLCPNQMRANGIIVDNLPIHLSYDKTSTHSITFPEEGISIPLCLNGCFSSIPTRTPSQHEIDTCKWLVLTSDSAWDLSVIPFADFEDAAKAFEDQARPRERTLLALRSDPLSSISSLFHDEYIIDTLQVSSMTSSKHLPSLPAAKLAQRWAISEATANKTLKVTTQKGVRNALYPIEQRFHTRQAQLRCPQLSGRHGRFYTDTFFSSVKSIDMATCCQLFGNDIGFTQVYPMRLKSEAHLSLKSFVHNVGIPHILHSDNAKELSQGEWRKVCNDFSIHTKNTEPHSPWKNRAEGHIRELK